MEYTLIHNLQAQLRVPSPTPRRYAARIRSPLGAIPRRLHSSRRVLGLPVLPLRWCHTVERNERKRTNFTIHSLHLRSAFINAFRLIGAVWPLTAVQFMFAGLKAKSTERRQTLILIVVCMDENFRIPGSPRVLSSYDTIEQEKTETTTETTLSVSRPRRRSPLIA